MDRITRKQQEYAHALMWELGEHAGYLSKAKAYESIKQAYEDAMDMDKTFSLKQSKCSKAEYENFIKYIQDLLLDHGIVTKYAFSPWADLEKFSYHCLKNKVCCVTGRKNANQVWVDPLPAGNQYTDINKKKYRRLSLSDDYEKKLKDIGYDAFLEEHPTCVAIRCELEVDHE